MWIQTFTGKKLDLWNPDPDVFSLEEIAMCLSRIPRFSGHTKFFYSVGQHSLWVANNMPVIHGIHGLLHDAHEAYTGDITTPVAHAINPQRTDALKHGIQKAIYMKLGLAIPTREEMDSVKMFDIKALAVEKRDLLLFDMDWGSQLPVVSRYKPLEEVPNMRDVQNDFLSYYEIYTEMHRKYLSKAKE